MSYKKERIKYIDMLKVIAILGVIFIHTFGIWPKAEIMNFRIMGLNQIFHYAVPLFLMISGALMLNKEIEIETYIKKRFIRILLPLIFFIIITIILQTYNYTHPLKEFWYAWMIIGVYLAIPIINKFIQNANMKEIEYYLAIFIIGSVFCQICLIFDISHAIDLTFFLGPISYLILGYYLSRKEFKISPNKIILISSIIFIISSIIKIKYFPSNFYPPGSYLTNYLNISIFEIMQTSAIFLIIKNIYQSTGKLKIIKNILEQKTVNKFINSVSRSTYGMYLLHMVIIIELKPIITKVLKLSGTGTLCTIILLVVLQFFITWIIIYVLGQIPYIKKLSGYY